MKNHGIPKNRQPQDVEADGSGFHESLERQQRLRELEQAELRRRTEWELLDADVSFQEFKARRDLKLILEPRAPLDEMDYRSYRNCRDLDKRKDAFDQNLTYDEKYVPAEDDGTGPAFVHPEPRRRR